MKNINRFIPALLTGTLSATAVIGGGVGIAIAFQTPESPRIPADAYRITAAEAEPYVILPNTTIYTLNNPFIAVAHNPLLDLAWFKRDKNIDTDNFVIDGTIDFGIMIGFNQNISLYGYGGSSIQYTDASLSTRKNYGVVIASTTNPTGQDSYTGNMYIDQTVSFTIESGNNTTYGVYYGGSAIWGSIVINGVFYISGSVGCQGLHLNGEMHGTLHIDGVFTIFAVNNTSIGVSIGSTMPGSNLLIGGIFNVSDATDYSSGGSYRAVQGTTKGVNITNINAGSTVTISGTFVISCKVNGGGAFVYGVTVDTTLSGSLTVNGTFALNALDTGSGSKNYGVNLAPSTILGTLSGQPKFFSKGDDWGNWKAKGGEEFWNGESESTTGDGSLALTTIKDDILPPAHFSVNVIKADGHDGNNRRTFNLRYKTMLVNFVTHLLSDSVAKEWFNNIINQIDIS